MSDETPQVSPEQELIDTLNSIGFEGTPGANQEQRHHALARLMTTDWADLEMVEHADYLLFPDTLTSRNRDGSWDEKTVMLRVPRDKDLRKARVQARGLAAKENMDPTLDKDLITNLENICILAYCIRNDSAPYEPWEPDPMILESKYDKVCLQQMWEKLERLNDVLNPAPNELSSGEIVALIVAIAKARHLGPLVVYGPGAQTSFVVSMVDLLLTSLGSKLSLEALGHLMQESSPLNDSAS